MKYLISILLAVGLMGCTITPIGVEPAPVYGCCYDYTYPAYYYEGRPYYHPYYGSRGYYRYRRG